MQYVVWVRVDSLKLKANVHYSIIFIINNSNYAVHLTKMPCVSSHHSAQLGIRSLGLTVSFKV